MKILAICQHYYPEPFVISELLSQLVSFGHEVHVVTGFPNYGYGRIMDGYDASHNSQEMINGVHVHRVKIYPRKDSKLSICRNYLSFWRNSKKYVKKMKGDFDVVFSMTLSPVIAASAGNLYQKKHKLPHLHYCVDLWPNSLVITNTIKGKGLIYKFFYHWSKSIYKKANRILISSPSFEEYFRNVLKISDIPINVLIQPSLSFPKAVEPYVYEENTFNIVYCGNMGKLQLLNYVYEMMEMAKDYPSLRFHFIGMGSNKKAFFEEVNKRGLEDKIIDHGALPASKAAPYLLGADALYLALTSEGYVGKTIPNKLIFYLSFGKPILAMIQHDGKEVLKKTKGAILVEESAEDLLRGVSDLMNMPVSKKEELGKNNLRSYQESYQLSTISRSLESELMSLINDFKSSATEVKK